MKHVFGFVLKAVAAAADVISGIYMPIMRVPDFVVADKLIFYISAEQR